MSAPSSRARATSTGPAPVVPPVRRMDFAFAELPRHWFFGHPFPTAIVNALSLLFPAGERAFIRSVKRYENAITDPRLKAAMRAFYGQEAHHQKEHLAANEAITAQGYELGSFLAWWERFAFERLEPRVPPHVRLAGTAAAEHFTATLAEVALGPGPLDSADPAMRQLLRWHAAEEIEHKSVAFDVLQAVDPRYSTRVLGFLMASLIIGTGWVVGTRHLLAQEARPLPPYPRAARERARMLLGRVGQRLVDYLRPGFHPEHHDNRGLAADYLASVGRLAS